MTKAELRKLKYNLVRNQTADPSEARKARDYSWKRIETMYGIQQTTQKERLKPLPKTIPAYLDQTSSYREHLYATDSIDRFKLKTLKTTKTQREKLWSEWSVKEDKKMPLKVKTLAQQINRSTKFEDPKNKGYFKNPYDINAGYGFAVVFYAFIDGISIEEAKFRITKMDAFDGDRYQYEVKTNGKKRK